PDPTLFPYTTLFRSTAVRNHGIRSVVDGGDAPLSWVDDGAAQPGRFRLGGAAGRRRCGGRGRKTRNPRDSGSPAGDDRGGRRQRSGEHTSELQSLTH